MDATLVQWLMAHEVSGEPPTIDELINRPEWHQRAARSGLGVRAFFSDAPANLEVARALCVGCPVRAGFTANERWQMRRPVA